MKINGKKETKQSEEKEKNKYQKPALTKYRKFRKVFGLASP